MRELYGRQICEATFRRSLDAIPENGNLRRIQRKLGNRPFVFLVSFCRLTAERTFHCQTFRCRHRLRSHERSVRRLNAPESPASKTESPKTARRKRTQRTQSNRAKWSNDLTPPSPDS